MSIDGNFRVAQPPTLIWERPEPVLRGSVALSLVQIANAAFSVADGENLQAVSLKRVAAKLEVPRLRLESYLSSRDDLLDLMLDVAYGEIELPPHSPDSNWRAELRALAQSTHATAARHPWLMLLVGTRPACGPNGLSYSERALSTLEGTGLDGLSTVQAVNTVIAYVYGFVQTAQPHRSRPLDDAELSRQAHTGEYLQAAASSGDHPNLARLFTAAAGVSTQQAFETGLEYVLDGIGNRIAAGAGAAVES